MTVKQRAKRKEIMTQMFTDEIHRMRLYRGKRMVGDFFACYWPRGDEL